MRHKPNQKWDFMKPNEKPYSEKLSTGIIDPVFKTSHNRYGFWDETWSECYGPFDTYQEAEESLEQYVKEFLQ